MRQRMGYGALLTVLGATIPFPVAAECLGSCLDGLVATLVSMLVYGVIGIVLLVMLIRAKWRRAGLWSLGGLALLALGVPLVSQAWVGWTLRGVEALEIVGTPPSMAERTPLLITPDETCQYSACEAVVLGRGAAGVHVVARSALDGLDLTEATAIADLPLEFWAGLGGADGQPVRRYLTPDERKVVAAEVDYLIIANWPYHVSVPGPVDAALRQNPAFAGLASGAVVRLLLAPVQPAGGNLLVADLRPDVLDLTLTDRALAIPLAPKNTAAAGNGVVGLDVAAQAICPNETEAGLQLCRSLLER
jgi:hypothetical protein